MRSEERLSTRLPLSLPQMLLLDTKGVGGQQRGLCPCRDWHQHPAAGFHCSSCTGAWVTTGVGTGL